MLTLIMDDFNQPQTVQPNDRPSPLRNLFKEIWQTVLLSLLLFAAINFATVRIRVQSISMQPTLFERDFVLVNKLAYRVGDLDRRDVVVFQPPIDAEKEPYIKRIIGLPGDTVRVMNGVVYINNLPLQEAYEAAPPNYNGEWKVPQGRVFVLGDNRNNSSDSHLWGMVPVDNIIGKAVVVYWPFAHWKVLDPATAAAAGL
jgi:signal peptidase I